MNNYILTEYDVSIFSKCSGTVWLILEYDTCILKKIVKPIGNHTYKYLHRGIYSPYSHIPRRSYRTALDDKPFIIFYEFSMADI